MSEILFVGRMSGPHPNQFTGDNFGEFHDELLAIPLPITEEGLEVRLYNSAAFHVWTVVNHLDEGYQLITAAQHTSGSIACEQLEIHQGRREKQYLGLGWLSIARKSLLDCASQVNIDEEQLAESVFFETSSEKRERLSRLVLASFQPYGAYERYAFAAGVALGRVQSRPFQGVFPSEGDELPALVQGHLF